ncbi:hypothetical protein ACFOW1_03130 [Parasediminibacterium paludis]|uniref:Uncharacterized protein n=1 Tax=Parasediminibacterium paludis TaxID=908966 RepID=A0ABV8PTE8_9BACT
MPFVDVAYGYLAFLFLLAMLLERKHAFSHGKNLLATLNVTLLFFVLYKCLDYYQLYKMAQIFGVSITFDGLLKLMSTNKWEAFKNMAVLLLPFLFLFKKLSANVVLTFAALTLVKWDVIERLYNKIAYPNITKSYYQPEYSVFHVLNYGCLFIAIYALLFLLKRLPHQAK